MMPSGSGPVPPGAGEGSAQPQGGPDFTGPAADDGPACSHGGPEATAPAADDEPACSHGGPEVTPPGAVGWSARLQGGLGSMPPGAGGRSTQLSCEAGPTPATDLSADLSVAMAGAGTPTGSGGANTGRTVVISQPVPETGWSAAKLSRPPAAGLPHTVQNRAPSSTS